MYKPTILSYSKIERGMDGLIATFKSPFVRMKCLRNNKHLLERKKRSKKKKVITTLSLSFSVSR